MMSDEELTRVLCTWKTLDAEIMRMSIDEIGRAIEIEMNGLTRHNFANSGLARPSFIRRLEMRKWRLARKQRNTAIDKRLKKKTRTARQ